MNLGISRRSSCENTCLVSLHLFCVDSAKYGTVKKSSDKSSSLLGSQSTLRFHIHQSVFIAFWKPIVGEVEWILCFVTRLPTKFFWCYCFCEYYLSLLCRVWWSTISWYQRKYHKSRHETIWSSSCIWSTVKSI